MKKRILCVCLVFILCLPLLPLNVSAAAPSMQNVRISSEGILIWDAFPGARNTVSQ